MSVTVTLGTHTVPLKAPIAMRRTQVDLAVRKSALEGLCAALGLCWGGKALRTAYDYNACAYGEQVFEELTSLGFAAEEIYAAGVKALELCRDVPTEAGVARADSFTAPQREDSTR
jgi:hypothetical protein